MVRKNIMDRLAELENRSDDARFREAVAEVEAWFKAKQDLFEREEKMKNEEYKHETGPD